VYSLHPTMMEMLAKQRAGELSLQAAQPRRCQSRGETEPQWETKSEWETKSQWEIVASGTKTSNRGSPSNPGKLTSVRKAAGWALVEIGLRLAVPRRRLVPPGRAVQGPSAARRRRGVTVAR
jgi:hypothetical protein